MNKEIKYWMLGFLAFISGIFALTAAILSEDFLGLTPCPLCLIERWPYWALIIIGFFILMLTRWSLHSTRTQIVRKKLAGLAVVSSLVAAGLGFLHVGVERHLWKSPFPECSAFTKNIEDIMSFSRISKPCDMPTYPIAFIKLSMAELNTVYAGLVFFALVMLRNSQEKQ